MSLRAHLHRKHFVEYDNGVFNYNNVELLEFLELNGVNVWVSEDECQWEIDLYSLKVFLEKYNIEGIENEIVFSEYTNKELKDTFEQWINIASNPKNSNDTSVIFISWF